MKLLKHIQNMWFSVFEYLVQVCSKNFAWGAVLDLQKRTSGPEVELLNFTPWDLSIWPILREKVDGLADFYECEFWYLF